MAIPEQNIDPIFSLPNAVSSVLITAGNTSSQGNGTIGTDIFLAHTVAPTDGFIQRVRFIPTATTPTTTTATVGRVFFSSVSSGATTNANTFLWQELVLPSISASNAASAVLWFDVSVGFALPNGTTILVTNHATPAANTAWRALVINGKY